VSVVYDLSGWNALVTGSTKGIGLATARLLGASGAHVLVHGTDQARCDDVSDTIPGSLGVAGDLADRSARDDLCARVLAACGGRLDILVHNASVFPQATIESQTVDEFERVLDINVVAWFHLTKRLLPALLAAPHPAVVIVSSAVVRMGLADSPAYAASKSAEIGMANHLAAELGPQGVRVNSVLPGLIDTPGTRAVRVTDESYIEFARGRQMLPIRLQSDDIAHGIVFLCMPAARAITAASLDMNGGLTAAWSSAGTGDRDKRG
jgi:NAD(P)-dependent dehydrogenase (short-subunit alcohol dehydrogenase family)